MGAEEFVKRWNQAFFPDGKTYNDATLDMEVTLVFPGGKVQFAVQGVTLKTRVNEIARLYAGSLPNQAPSELATQPVIAPAQPEGTRGLKEAIEEEVEKSEGGEPEREVIANEHVEYRGNTYLVQHYRIEGEDQFSIFNQSSGGKIGVETVTGRSILKLYRKSVDK